MLSACQSRTIANLSTEPHDHIVLAHILRLGYMLGIFSLTCYVHYSVFDFVTVLPLNDPNHIELWFTVYLY
jgi:hypothetical protein